MGPYIVFKGAGGLVEGEEFYIGYGESVVVGRSSSCDISLKKCEKYLLLDPGEKSSEKHFQTVSRKHLRISFYSTTKIELEDLSSNGSYLDGNLINKKTVITDIRANSHEIVLGTKEQFVLEWVGEEVPDELIQEVKEEKKEEGVIRLEDIEEGN